MTTIMAVIIAMAIIIIMDTTTIINLTMNITIMTITTPWRAMASTRSITARD
ncbi:hypothetical protein [Methylocystis sp.]|uniref:hypothetical protein n=1 Tax=Methylocystis sp. TaxID=1911079 RepID=UPI003DA370D8